VTGESAAHLGLSVAVLSLLAVLLSTFVFSLNTLVCGIGWAILLPLWLIGFASGAIGLMDAPTGKVRGMSVAALLLLGVNAIIMCAFIYRTLDPEG
jgi:hypothetical protein